MRWFALAGAVVAASGGGASLAFGFDDHVLVVTGTGQSAGNCTAIDLDPPWTSAPDLEQVGALPVVRHFLGRHYVVDRAPGGGVHVIDPATFDTIAQYPVSGRPRDILVVNDGSAYVTRYESRWLYEMDPGCGAVVDSVDLGLFADADGVPEMSMMARDGTRLFVQIQRQDFVNGPPFLPGLLAVVDVSTNALVDVDPGTAGVQAIALAGLWPDHKMQVEAGSRRLYVSTPGPRLDVSGGVEEIDLDGLVRLGFLVSEEQMSVDVGAFLLVSDTKGYLIGHTDIIESSHLTAFSRPDGSRLGEVYSGLFFKAESMAFDAITSRLFFPEPNGPGVHVFDTVTDAQLTAVPVPTGTNPVDLVIARDGTVDAPLPSNDGDRVSRAVPNPTTGGTWIRLARPMDRVRLTIHDSRGAIVRELSGLHWDGLDGRGARAGAGIYFYRVRTEEIADTGRIVVLR